MRINNDIITFDSTDMSAVSNTTLGHNIEHVANLCLQLVCTGAPVGTLKLQVSCDEGGPNGQTEAQRLIGVSNWSDLSGATVAISAAGVYSINVANIGSNWIRAVYTKTSGTGTITSARVNTKGF